MRHVRRFRRRDGNRIIRRHRHTFRLDADIDLTDHGAALKIDDCCDRVILVSDVEPLVVGRDNELFRILARRQVVKVLVCRRVIDLHGIAIAGADEEVLFVARERDAAWPLPHLERAHHRHRRGVDHRNRVVFFVGDIGFMGFQSARRAESGGDHQQPDLGQHLGNHYPCCRASLCAAVRMNPQSGRHGAYHAKDPLPRAQLYYGTM